MRKCCNLAHKDLNDLLWSVDKTVRDVLDSQELKNLGSEIKDSLSRAGEDIFDSFSGSRPPRNPGQRSGPYSQRRQPPPGGYRQDQAPPPPPPGSARGAWKTPGRPQSYGRVWNWQNGRPQSYSWTPRTGNAQAEGPYRGKVVGREPRWKRGGAMAAAGFGLFGAFCGAVTLLGLGLQMMVGNVYAIDSFIAMLIFFTAFTAVTGAIGIAGVVKLAGKNRMRKVWKYLKGRDFCKLSEIADRLRLEEKKVLRVIEKMLDLQLLPQGHLDDTKTCLMLTDETYARYLESQEEKAEEEKKAREAAEDPQKVALANMVREGSEYIRRIREINNDLPEEEISDKLDSLETVCQQIFAYVADHPDKLPAIRKFISYYLPTTLKLCEAYYKLDRQNTGVESEQKTMQEILSALGNIDLAFHNLLDDLMENEYMDLSADISVLQSMMAQEGLMDDFPGMDDKDPPKTAKTPAPGAQPPAKDDDKPYEPELHL